MKARTVLLLVAISAWQFSPAHLTPASAQGQAGVASVYSTESGSKTASGQKLNPAALTAAHRTLPLGTVLRVTDLRSGKWVIVTVNDRGPVPKTRIIDLSYGAAQMLGLRAHGVETVRLDLVPKSEAALVAQNFAPAAPLTSPQP